jgi:hypothetical protein
MSPAAVWWQTPESHWPSRKTVTQARSGAAGEVAGRPAPSRLPPLPAAGPAGAGPSARDRGAARAGERSERALARPAYCL